MPHTEINIETTNFYSAEWLKSQGLLCDLIRGHGMEKSVNRGTIVLGRINHDVAEFLRNMIRVGSLILRTNFLFRFYVIHKKSHSCSNASSFPSAPEFAKTLSISVF